MNIIEIDDLTHPQIQIFSSLTERQLHDYEFRGERGFFIAESPKVIGVAIERGYKPYALLCERKHITGDAAAIIAKFPEIPVYTGERELLSQLTGYVLTRGVLCVMKRPVLPSLEDVCRHARLLCVLQSVTDTTNIGAIFRSTAALGVDGIVISSDTCDPLNRRSVRVSMGTVFCVPWTKVEHPVTELRNLGVTTAALALCKNAISLDNEVLKKEAKLAVVFGTEGAGLPRSVIEKCDFTVTIPMSYGIDSLNVAAAAAVTFWELRKKNQ